MPSVGGRPGYTFCEVVVLQPPARYLGGARTATPTTPTPPTTPPVVPADRSRAVRVGHRAADGGDLELCRARSPSGSRLGALRYRDFRLIFFGQAVGATGTWMQLVAQGWLVYTLTDSPFYLGLVGLARAVPAFLFALVGGAVADRYDRRAIMAIANGVISALALTLGVLTLSGVVQVWHVVLLAFVMGTAFSFEMPSRQSLVSHTVEPKEVVNAVGLNSVAFNTAAVIGPALAAVLIELIGEGGVFLVNAASHLVIVPAALMMRPVKGSPSQGGILANVVDGLRYVRRAPELLGLVLLGATLSLLARPYGQLMPVFARDILEAGASGLGALNAATGAGALVGAVLVATSGSYPRRGLVLVLSGAGFGAALVLFSLSTSFVLSLVIAIGLGFFSAFAGINSNAMLQTHSDPRMRGRVLSLHGLSMMGVVPLGVMLEGALGSLVGVPLVLGIGGAISFLVALGVAFLAPKVRSLE